VPARGNRGGFLAGAPAIDDADQRVREDDVAADAADLARDESGFVRRQRELLVITDRWLGVAGPLELAKHVQALIHFDRPKLANRWTPE
jgi:hypothetical protein